MIKPRASSQAMEIMHLNAKLADLKDEHYRSLLTISAVLELLIDKGLLTREELQNKEAELDNQMESLIAAAALPTL